MPDCSQEMAPMLQAPAASLVSHLENVGPQGKPVQQGL